MISKNSHRRPMTNTPNSILKIEREEFILGGKTYITPSASQKPPKKCINISNHGKEEYQWNLPAKKLVTKIKITNKHMRIESFRLSIKLLYRIKKKKSAQMRIAS